MKGEKSMNVAYIRVSSTDQNEARQIEALKDKNIDRYFTEKVSGKNMERPALQEMRYPRFYQAWEIHGGSFEDNA